MHQPSMLNSFRTGESLNFANGSRYVLQGVVVEFQMLVFESRSTPVQKIDVKTAGQHKLNKAVARTEVENVWPVHEREDQQQRNRMPLLLRDNRSVAVKLGLIQRPNKFFGRLRDRRLRGHYLVKRP